MLKANVRKLVAPRKNVRVAFVFFMCGNCLLFCCTSKSSNESSPKFNQYFVQGEQLYNSHCSNCHQKNGKGLGRLYPPLESSDYMQDSLIEVLCMMRYGKSGEIIVNGKAFNQAMPGIPTLTDLEIAEIATYIYNSWGNKTGIIEVKEASNMLNSCEAH